ALKTSESEFVVAPKPGNGRGASNWSWHRIWRWGGVSNRDRGKRHGNNERSNRLDPRPVDHDPRINTDSGHGAAGNSRPHSRDRRSDAWACRVSTRPKHPRDCPNGTDARNNADAVHAGDKPHNSCTQQHSGNDESIINTGNDQSTVNAGNQFSEWRQHNAGNSHST